MKKNSAIYMTRKTTNQNANQNYVTEPIENKAYNFSFASDVTAYEKLKSAEKEAVLMLSKTKESMVTLSKIRQDNKMSNSRVAGVARELNELIKVMSIYV